MIRTHNTHISKLDRTKVFSQRGILDKPYGLWYSIDDEWLDFCKSEMPYKLQEYTFTLKLNLKSILVINSKPKLVKFWNKYKCDHPHFVGVKLIPEEYRIKTVDWGKVANDYKGIEFTNFSRFKYGMNLPMEIMRTIWFMTWDVSSGCIWDSSAIISYSRKKMEMTWLSNPDTI